MLPAQLLLRETVAIVPAFNRVNVLFDIIDECANTLEIMEDPSGLVLGEPHHRVKARIL